ncbi:hypothetical protein GOB10_28090, partial [Sinorhizobium meliloti]|nr:hypothetical protein [Sinorhizobium meliloti]MDW9843897.1 hypothetical protein [Sinorhizobium meliloti]MDW9899550.1 hypothetical protein [Sinorhizobium meliloti]MDW9998545.1 hypothetical protein [Sinorhizobium meliloti]
PDLNPIEKLFAKIKHWLREAQARSRDAIHDAAMRSAARGDCASKIGQPVLSRPHRAAAKLRLRTEASTRRGIKLTRD